MDQVKDKKEEEKKKAGFLANLVGGGKAASGSAIPGLGAGAGGAGSFGGLGQLLTGGGWRALFATGGLLSTKAGIVGALLVASGVFGGLGVLGYKLFGPSAADRAGTTYSLFAPRPAEEQAAIEAERAAADGKSASLEALVAANQGSGEQAQASEAQAGEASAGAVVDAAAPSASASPASPKNGGVTGNKAAKLGAGNSKLGQLSKLSMGGGGGGSGASMSLGGARPMSGTGGSLKAMSSPKGSAAPTRGLARKLGSRGAMSQLRGVQRDQRGATSSMGAGSTYDGGPRMIGSGATTSSTPGPTAPSDAPGNPNPVGMVNDNFPDPPKPLAKGWATPWAEAMNMAKMAILAGVALLFVAGRLMSAPEPSGMTKALAYGLMAMAAVAGALAMKMGHMISQEPYAQAGHGGLLMAAGGALVASAGLMIAAQAAGGANTLLNILMVTSGAASLGLLLVAQIQQPKRYPPWKFQDGQPPDLNHRTTTSDGQQVGGGGLFGMAHPPKYGWLKDQLPC